MIGKPYIEFYGEEGYEKNMEGNLDFMRQGYRIDDFETEEFNSKGEKVYFANNVIGIIRDGYFVSTWGTQRDFTMLRKTITELERKNSELGLFTYILWHELKSPLVTIRGFLGYLNKNIKLQKWEHVQSDLSRISQAADKMNYMIVNLLDILRAGHMMNVSEPITFQEIVQKGITSLQGNLDEHKIQVEINAEFPLICGDRERLSEVVEALVENAV